ncbi:MAG: cytochrome c [Alphaproteobacteria bacterium]|jgi:cytochrome c556
MRVLTGMAVVALVLGGATIFAPQPAQAQMGKLMDEIKANVSNSAHAGAIYERRAAMRKLSSAMKGVAGYVKAGKGSHASVAAEAKKIAAIAAKLPGMFPKGTEMAIYKEVTGAKPEIWSTSGEFKAAADNLASLAMSLEKAASSSGANQKSIGAVFGLVGKNGCGGCHRTFRQKLK